MYLSLRRLCFPMTIHESFAVRLVEVEYVGPLASSSKHPIVLGRWALTTALSLIRDVSSLPRYRSFALFTLT